MDTLKLVRDARRAIDAITDAAARDKQPSKWPYPLFLQRLSKKWGTIIRRLHILRFHRDIYTDCHIATSLTNSIAEDTPAHLPGDTEERLYAMHKALDQIGVQARQAFLLNRLRGCSYVQISYHLGISTREVEDHIAHAVLVLALERIRLEDNQQHV